MTSIETDINVHLKAVTDAEIRADWPAYLRHVEAALEIDPKNPAALLSRGLFRLRFDLPGGWEDHEFRQPRLDLCEDLDEWPEWKGESLEGKHILIAGEQGLGDQIMFGRYVPEVLKRNPRRVTLHVRPELARLFADLCEDYPTLSVVTDDRDIASNDLDCWIAIASLPLHVGIISPFPLAFARCLIAIPQTDRINVGLCWSANPKHPRDAYRSMTFPDFEPVLSVPGCNFYAFQFGPAAAQNDGRAIDLAKYCHDFADTANLLAEMDVLVSVDTAIVHLAGTIGVDCHLIKPTPYLDWRWGKCGTWYRDDVMPMTIEASRRVLLEQHEQASYEPGIRSPRATDVSIVSRDTCETETRYGKMQYFARDKYVGRSLELYGEWSAMEVDLFRAFVKPGDTVVDAGANIGAHALALSELVGRQGHVYAFEPNERACIVLCENLATRSNCTPIKCGLGDSLRRYLVVCDESNPGGATLTSMPEEGEQWPSCVVRTLDSQDLWVDFLVADVEGMELAVLRGAEKTIERCRPVIYVENDRPQNTEALCSWLHEHKYRLYMHCPRLFNPNNWKGNKINVFGDLISSMILAIPREKFIPFDMASLGLARIRVKT